MIFHFEFTPSTISNFSPQRKQKVKSIVLAHYGAKITKGVFTEGILCQIDGSYMIEMDRLLRSGGYFVISGPPVQWPKQEKEWADLQNLAHTLCYELVIIDGNTAIWKKPSNNSCFALKSVTGPNLCDEHDDPNLAW